MKLVRGLSRAYGRAVECERLGGESANKHDRKRTASGRVVGESLRSVVERRLCCEDGCESVLKKRT